MTGAISPWYASSHAFVSPSGGHRTLSRFVRRTSRSSTRRSSTMADRVFRRRAELIQHARACVTVGTPPAEPRGMPQAPPVDLSIGHFAHGHRVDRNPIEL